MYYECRNGSIIKVICIITGECELLYSAEPKRFKHGATLFLVANRIPQLQGTILTGGEYGTGFDVIGRASVFQMNAAHKIAYVIWYSGIAVCVMLGGWIAWRVMQ